MSTVVRPMRDDEARTFLEIHGRSVRGLAAEHYPADVIAAWAGPAPISDEAVRGFLKNPDHEIRLLAELDGQPVGLGSLVVDNTELRACYVVPEAARRGVGSALVKEMEGIARNGGLTHLELHASVNAGTLLHGTRLRSIGAGGPCSSLRPSDGVCEDAQESQVLSTARGEVAGCGGGQFLIRPAISQSCSNQLPPVESRARKALKTGCTRVRELFFSPIARLRLEDASLNVAIDPHVLVPNTFVQTETAS